MARIRSIQPGFFTDEAVISVSDAARLLAIGLWTECTDDGVFPWKPATLKMRIFPADNRDMDGLLAELAAVKIVKKVKLGGSEIGLVRNFCRFQRPRKPNSSGLELGEYRTYVGLDARSTEPDDARDTDSTEPEPVQATPVPQKSGKSKQMEGRGEEGRVGESKTTDDDGFPPPREANGKAYAFEARTIRLVQADFDKWRKAFPAISLEAELWALDDWAGQQGKRWFSAVSGALAKKNREASDRALSIRTDAETRANQGTGPPNEKAERWRGIL